MTDVSAPLYPAAILLPILSFPSWMLCILPLSWHFRQGNIAAGSLILWVVMMNFFNSINPLIWPCDNIEEWWDGHVWCDIHARLQVGCIVGTTASTAMIVRKLAKVMDTRNITVSSSRDNKVKEKVLEILWCWIYPLVLILLYYVVQPVRYMIYGVIGCLSAYDTSWPSLVLSFMWAPITIIVAAGYAGKPFLLLNIGSKILTTTQSSSRTAFTATVANLSALWPPATPPNLASSGSSSSASSSSLHTYLTPSGSLSLFPAPSLTLTPGPASTTPNASTPFSKYLRTASSRSTNGAKSLPATSYSCSSAPAAMHTARTRRC